MEVHTMVISATKEKKSPLTIEYEGQTASTKQGDENITIAAHTDSLIQWKIKEGCDIATIDAIQITEGVDVWAGNVPTQADAHTWKAVVRRAGLASFSISYTMKGESFTEDPKIAIRPS